jgi:Fe-Mn family superoxide dismutase
MVFLLPSLPYAYSALEPYIDEQTMRIHHDKHHQAYADKLNAALEKFPQLQKRKAEDLIADLNSVPAAIRAAVRNHGGGYVNHSFFWKILRKEVPIKAEILKAINKGFGSFDKFRQQFKDASLSLFGSGWVWLAINPANKELEILKTSNQDSPLSEGKIPVLAIDLWEHSYYLKYQNKRADYVDAFFNVIDWEKANEFFVKA